VNKRKSELPQQEMNSLIGKIIVRFSLVPIVIGFLVLVPAGTLNYWQVYLYIAVLVIPMVFVLGYFLKNDPKFLERRMRAKEKEKQQLIIQIVFSFIFLSGFIVPGFDKRFGWSDIPVGVVVLTDFVILLGYLIIFFVFRQNSYASRIVEVDKSQTVISTGLYSFIRHPMYFGVLIMFIPTPIALGSYWGLIPMAAIPLALIFRILNEEKVLSKDLPGYKEYCQKTRYRLIPFIW
jgi:protein-S-isoprenylcysteine O-methyltransferase Ste14